MLRTIHLGLGSNIEPRASYLAEARLSIEDAVGEVVAQSSVYESEPWGFQSDTWFLNQVLVCQTTLPLLEVLRTTQSIERQLGRTAKTRGIYRARTLDIDILLAGDERIGTPELQIPHPHIADRRFVLAPLAELDPNGHAPGVTASWRELLARCTDTGAVRLYAR